MEPLRREASSVLKFLFGWHWHSARCGLFYDPITNCAEFNAVNQALQAGIAPEDIILRTIYTDTLKNKIPCLNCQPWIDKLGIRVINGDYAY